MSIRSIKTISLMVLFTLSAHSIVLGMLRRTPVAPTATGIFAATAPALVQFPWQQQPDQQWARPEWMKDVTTANTQQWNQVAPPYEAQMNQYASAPTQWAQPYAAPAQVADRDPYNNMSRTPKSARPYFLKAELKGSKQDQQQSSRNKNYNKYFSPILKGFLAGGGIIYAYLNIPEGVKHYYLYKSKIPGTKAYQVAQFIENEDWKGLENFAMEHTDQMIIDSLPLTGKNSGIPTQENKITKLNNELKLAAIKLSWSKIIGLINVISTQSKNPKAQIYGKYIIAKIVNYLIKLDATQPPIILPCETLQDAIDVQDLDMFNFYLKNQDSNPIHAQKNALQSLIYLLRQMTEKQKKSDDITPTSKTQNTMINMLLNYGKSLPYAGPLTEEKESNRTLARQGLRAAARMINDASLQQKFLNYLGYESVEYSPEEMVTLAPQLHPSLIREENSKLVVKDFRKQPNE